MMSLKSYLAQRSFTETRLFGRPFALALIGLFLSAILPTQAGVLIVAEPCGAPGMRRTIGWGSSAWGSSYAASRWASVQLALEPEAAGYRFAPGRTPC